LLREQANRTSKTRFRVVSQTKFEATGGLGPNGHETWAFTRATATGDKATPRPRRWPKTSPQTLAGEGNFLFAGHDMSKEKKTKFDRAAQDAMSRARNSQAERPRTRANKNKQKHKLAPRSCWRILHAAWAEHYHGILAPCSASGTKLYRICPQVRQPSTAVESPGL